MEGGDVEGRVSNIINQEGGEGDVVGYFKFLIFDFWFLIFDFYQGGGGGGGGAQQQQQQQEEKMKQMNDMKNSILSQVLDQEAR